MTVSLEQLSVSAPSTVLLTVFCGGIAASLGLSAAVRLPVVAAYVGGAGSSKRHRVLLSILFTVGFVAGLVLLGLTAAPPGEAARPAFHVNKCLFWALGLGLFVVGVCVSGLISPQLLPVKWQGAAERLRSVATPGALVLGGAFGLLQGPACQGSMGHLLALVEALGSQRTSLYGCVILLAFAVGQSVTILATAILTSLIEPDLAMRFRRWMCSIEDRMRLLAGNVLMVLGIYFVIVG